MAELFLELISEQIPARFQKFGAETLGKELEKHLSSLSPKIRKYISDPRRIGCVLEINAEIPAKKISVKGPKLTAPDQAINGFARKYGVQPQELKQENGAFFFEEEMPARSAEHILPEELPELLWNFPWPKAMRWGDGSRFSWVRPLHKIVCLFDGKLIPFSLERDGDNAHGLKSGTLSEDGPFGYQKEFEVSSASQWEDHLRSKGLIPFHEERFEKVKNSLSEIGKENNLTVITNDRLLNEVTGLCEMPTAYLGQIDPAHMALPHEVRDDLMGEHQRYFPTSQNGKAAPYFAFLANHPFDDHQFVSHGNERVLRARLEDGRHFWDQDRKRTLESRIDDLEKMTFQEGLGTQKERALRLQKLSGKIAEKLDFTPAIQEKASRAGLLLKTDLVSEMVGELPSLQGIMGGYYAEHDGEKQEICQAISQQYLPKGNSGEVPANPVSICTALADRIDTLVGFFSISLTPTGSGDPFGLRRVALGIFRILQENELNADLGALLQLATEKPLPEKLEDFLIERLRVQLRQKGLDADITDATLNLETPKIFSKTIFKKLDGELVFNIPQRALRLQKANKSEIEFQNFLESYRRANNILQAEIKKGWNPLEHKIDRNLLKEDAERGLWSLIQRYSPSLSTPQRDLKKGNFFELINIYISTTSYIQNFFELQINDSDSKIRNNRLSLLSGLLDMYNQVWDFSKIEKKGSM